MRFELFIAVRCVMAYCSLVCG